ncbi:MAG: diacylglycerol kinase family lipid kinase [Verrucomicrobiota bacterium]
MKVKTSKYPRPEKVHVVINPAPSRRVPLLAILNQYFRKAGIYWEVSITHGDGDGRIQAEKAIEGGADVIAVYGGDGTVKEVASALVGTDIPLLILPGGTGNLVAVELGIDRQLDKACARVCGSSFRTRAMDVGKMGEHYFLLRIGCGLETSVVQDATREMKDRHGKWAYVFSALKVLQELPVANYNIVLDETETYRAKGVACLVANAGKVGLGQMSLSPAVDIADGKLDVFFLKKANVPGLMQIAGKMMGLDRMKLSDVVPDLDVLKEVNHWQVESVLIETDPVLDIQVDGDVVAETPQLMRVLPGALQVVV